MTERDAQDWLADLIQSDGEVRDVVTFADMAMLTRNRGLVITMEDGTEFQVTIVRSSSPDYQPDDDDD